MERLSFRWLMGGLILLWFVLTAGSLTWFLMEEARGTRQLAYEASRTLFSMVETMRGWNASHGGVYASVTKDNPPNPYLDKLKIPNRDLEVNGLSLTLVNPAYMTRQLAELFEKQVGLRLHITSLNPIRPANKADPWETEALLTFEKGAKERFSLIRSEEGGLLYRYMAPLLVKEPCLKCHEQQGYKLGDIRGGISIGVPGDLILSARHHQTRNLIVGHTAMFILLSLLTVLFFRRINAHMRTLEETRAGQEALIAERTEELRLSNSELEQFAYAASHDLQEPLRMVSGYMGLLEKRYKDKLDDDAREFIGFATDGARRMHVMIQDLLDYSRISTQGGKMIETDSGAALKTALDNLALAMEESEAVVIHDDVMPMVKADSGQLTRLFQNLIGNAIKYRRDGVAPKITVTAEVRDQEVHFAVADNGIGISPSKHEEIFMLFHRIENGAGKPGTGIGLAVCKKITERHGGRLWIDSEPGQGSTFHFTIALDGVAPGVAFP